MPSDTASDTRTGDSIRAPVIGSIEQYIPGEDFAQYKSRLDQFFIGNAVDKQRRVALTITLMGPVCYNVLESLSAPEKPEQKSYDQIMEMLQQHYKPTRNIHAERYKFNTRQQMEGETLQDYIVELKSLSRTCNFRTFLEEALTDRLISGIRNNRLRAKLLDQKELKWDTAQQMCTTDALTSEGVQMMGNAAAVFKVSSQNPQGAWESREGRNQQRNRGARSNGKVTNTQQRSSTPHPQSHKNNQQGSQQKDKACGQCGLVHPSGSCKAWNSTCHKCAQKGHWARLCRTR
ncbi:uncharacterized protein LOC129810266 isoform X2 [Phlebotomus papatasi]|uniref:uncharacterized protein LOC129810266 isoform X2 n=1 Tax=Phlebotomus papatasi TaxID=29031 RepID=UPI00248339F2|nr:uncharacterized protein LOC129810266 isoform X2 [Phlebotomus papatasi]